VKNGRPARTGIWLGLKPKPCFLIAPFSSDLLRWISFVLTPPFPTRLLMIFMPIHRFRIPTWEDEYLVQTLSIGWLRQNCRTHPVPKGVTLLDRLLVLLHRKALAKRPDRTISSSLPYLQHNDIPFVLDIRIDERLLIELLLVVSRECLAILVAVI